MSGKRWFAIILAAGRGPEDPMAKAYAVANKCLIPIAGKPMLLRVAKALRQSGWIDSVIVSIEAAVHVADLKCVTPAGSAPASILAAIKSGNIDFPVLVTTGDHALLTPEMIRYFCDQSKKSGADFTAGLARAETIRAAYPGAVRTYFNLGQDRVSGCNIFALMNERALKVVDRWQYLDGVRKQPWRLVAAFGLSPLIKYALGVLSLDRAFAIASSRLGLKAKPILMPFAEAAIDIDKPVDKELAEAILAKQR